MNVDASLQHVTRAALAYDPPRLALALPTERTTVLAPPDPGLAALREAALPLARDERAPTVGAVETYLRALPRELAPGCVLGWDRDRLTASPAVERTVVLANLATLRTREARDRRDGKARATAFQAAAGLWAAVGAQHAALGPHDAWDGAGTWPATATPAYARHQALHCLTLARLAMYAACRAIPGIPDAQVSAPLARAVSKAWAEGAPASERPEVLALSALLHAAVKAHYAQHLLASARAQRLGHATHLMAEAVNLCVSLRAKLLPDARSAHEQGLRQKRRLEAGLGRRAARHPVRDSVPADTERGIYDEWDVALARVDALYDTLKRDYDALADENSAVIQDLIAPPPADAQPQPAYLEKAPYFPAAEPPDPALLGRTADRAAGPSSPPPSSPPAPALARPVPAGLRPVAGRPAAFADAAHPAADVLAELPAEVRAYVRELEATVARIAPHDPGLVARTAAHEARPFYAALGVPPPAWARSDASE